jgi:F-type H+-transporting ATPase subunit gamma
MASTREIQRRIKSVANIKQVTRAMEAVAASRMRRAQQMVAATRPFADKAFDVLHYLARLPVVESNLNALLQGREVKKTCVVLVSGDRGLAGGFNANVIRFGAREIAMAREVGSDVCAVTIGRKGRDWLHRYDPIVHAEFQGLPDAPSRADLTPITRLLIDDYLQGVFDKVQLVYTDFVNTLVQNPVSVQLLPVVPATPSVPMAPDYVFEPDAETVLRRAIFEFTEVQIVRAVYESLASEYSARMVAMRNATEAADDLLTDLTLRYNKARQEGITSELMDIVGGTTALEQAHAA